MTGDRPPRSRGERGGRGERRERSADAPLDASGVASQQDGSVTAERGERPARDERGPRPERTDRTDRADRADGRRDRRGEGPPESFEAASRSEMEPAAFDQEATAFVPHDEATNPDAAPRRDGEERRGRSRDRYGRDRRERAPREGADGAPLQNASAEGEQQSTMDFDRAPAPAPARAPYVSGYTPEAEPVAIPVAVIAMTEVIAVTEVTMVTAPAPVAAVAAVEPAAPPAVPAAPAAPVSAAEPERAPVPRPAVRPEAAPVASDTGRASLPKVPSFELPLGDLAQIAESSGLQWVNSDATRIASAQQAMAAEVQPVRVPRERPPVVVAQDSDLKLVETRRDLTHVVLPFEHTAEGAPRNS